MCVTNELKKEKGKCNDINGDSPPAVEISANELLGLGACHNPVPVFGHMIVGKLFC